ncbi:uncharacterized protein LOC106139441 [Amyelois transitella]|uniref:uncharacterized protein LOC106139441 n=1 Tax=Amyelois transitella TaxID=680683 RepID=UPI00298F7649|nr:uncharacterized protein LOC106139441 [Amyelois transitella]
MMKPGKSVDVREEIAEVHTAARSPSPKHKTKARPRSRSGSRKLSNGHTEGLDAIEMAPAVEETSSDKVKTRESWIKSEHESLDVELPIHDQIKQGILGFVEKEFKKSDKNPSFVFYSHDPNGLDEKFMKTLSRPSSGHKEKRSPSYRKKKRHSSRHRDRDLHDFEIPGSSLSALEKVDDYLKEYNKDEVVTLSGELEIEANDVENNNGTSKELRHKPRKTRRKTREERQESNMNGRDVSPKVFKTGAKIKTGGKPVRPTDLTTMLESLESNMPYHDQYIDNPFSSPSPLTSPNDERLGPFGSNRPEKIYLQGGGTFRAVSRDRILESQQSREGDKYLRLGDLTPLDVAIFGQRAWRSVSRACPGVLGGLALLHLLLVGGSDGLDAAHLSFHAVLTMPYVAAYYFFCVLCLMCVLDGLDITTMDLSRGLQPHFQSIVLVILYTACLLVCACARGHDEMMLYQYTAMVGDFTNNVTHPTTIPPFYYTWTHFSIWRAVLAILGLVYYIISNPPDMVLANLTKLLQFKHSLQSIG